MFAVAIVSSFAFADEKPFEDTIVNNPLYSADFPPKERTEFWTYISHAILNQQFDKVLEKMKTINELSDKSGLSLMEFKSYVSMKFACLHATCDKTIVIEYLDRLTDYTRESTQWKKEIFVIEYALSLYYATLGEFEKAYDALTRFYGEHKKRHAEWEFFNSTWTGLTLEHHAACILAAVGRYEEAIAICNMLVDLPFMSSTDPKLFANIFANTSEIERHNVLSLIGELQKKRAYFKEKDVWSYYCQVTFVAAYKMDAVGNETDEFCGFNFYFQWLQKHGKWTEPPFAQPCCVPYLTRWFVPLAPVVVNKELFREEQ